jgi:hypothetical protein
MNKKVVIGIVLSLAFVALTASVNAALPVTDFTEHEDAGGACRIYVPPHREILLVADHSDTGEFGGSNRILISQSASPSGMGPPFIPVVAFEDNPDRNEFSKSLGSGIVQKLVPSGQIQVFRRGTTVFVIWTVRLTAPANPAFPGNLALMLPPGRLVLRGYGAAYHMDSTTTFPAGWTMHMDTPGRYNAHATFSCPAWRYSGPVAQAYAPFLVADRTITWTAP